MITPKAPQRRNHCLSLRNNVCRTFEECETEIEKVNKEGSKQQNHENSKLMSEAKAGRPKECNEVVGEKWRKVRQVTP